MAKQFLSAISCYPGAVGSPGLYLGTDTTTGFYRIGANNIGVTISGSKVLDILSTGLTVVGVVSITGTTKTAASFYAGSTTPDNTTRLNYDGAFWATSLNAGTYLSMGGGATITPANYGTFGVNNHGSLLFTSNLYMNNGAFKIANTHASMAGAAMLVPGNGQTRQGFFEFWTTPTGAVTVDAAFAPATPNFTISTSGNIAIGTNKAIYLDGINASGNTYIIESGADVLDLVAGGTTTLRLTTTGATVTGTIAATGVVTGSNLSGTNTGDSAANSSTHYIGTTAIALNRSSASQSLTGITSIDGNAATATELVVTDLRAVALTPSYFGMGANFAFMQNSTDALSDGGTYHAVMQVQQWSDGSGGGSRELAFTDNNNLWIRGSGSALTSWGDWKKLLTVNPTTKVSGTFDTTATSPTNTTRLNYDGYLYATRFYGDGSQLTGVTTAPSGDIYAFAAAYG